MDLKTVDGQKAHFSGLCKTLKMIFKFHKHYKWFDEYEDRLDSWERVFSKSDGESLSAALKDWVDNQSSEFKLKAPMPADIRPYYTQRMERKRCSERSEDEKPKHLYQQMSVMNFDPSKVEKGKLLATADIIRKMRAKRPDTGAYDSKGRLKGFEKSYLHTFVEGILKAADDARYLDAKHKEKVS